MKSSNWMPLYIADYLSNTLHLNAETSGAYLFLIMAYWQSEQPLPDDSDQLCTIARVNPAKWAKVRPILARFFQVEDGLWRHARIDGELSHAREVMEKRSKAGTASADKRAASAASSEPTPEPTHVGTHEPSLVDTTYLGPKEEKKIIDKKLTEAAREGRASPTSTAKGRKERWEQVILTEVIQRHGAEEGWRIVEAYQRGDPEAKRLFNAVSDSLKLSRKSA